MEYLERAEQLRAILDQSNVPQNNTGNTATGQEMRGTNGGPAGAKPADEVRTKPPSFASLNGGKVVEALATLPRVPPSVVQHSDLTWAKSHRTRKRRACERTWAAPSSRRSPT